MNTLKINLMILLLLTLENVFNVQAGPADDCEKSINNKFGPSHSARGYLNNMFTVEEKGSINLNSNLDYVQYFIYIRDNVALGNMRTVTQFCGNDAANVRACLDDLRGFNIYERMDRKEVFNVFFENYSLNMLPIESRTRAYYTATYLVVNVNAGTKTAIQWCTEKYRR